MPVGDTRSMSEDLSFCWSSVDARPLHLQVDAGDEDGKRRRREPRELPQRPADPTAKMLQITCARCHKLTFEGKVRLCFLLMNFCQHNCGDLSRMHPRLSRLL